MVASGALVLIGFLTKTASVMVGLASPGFVLSWSPTAFLNLFGGELSIIYLFSMAMAVSLIGPGAFSLDARMFGRRRIRIPSASHSSRT